MYATSKKELEQMLADANIETLEMFKILGYKREGTIPRYFWCVIGKNY